MVFERDILNSVDWENLGPLVFHHGLAAKVDRLHSENKLEVPIKWSEAFRSHTRDQIMRRHRYIQTLEFISERLNNREIPWIVLKGLPAAQRYYKHPLDRSFSDVDILVPKKYNSQVEKIFNHSPLKLIKEKKFRENSHKMSFDDETQKLLPIEFHFGLGDFPIKEEILFLRKQGFRIRKSESQSLDVWVLNQKDDLDYLLYHACVQHRLSHLKWMVDFHEIGPRLLFNHQSEYKKIDQSSQFVGGILTKQGSKRHRQIWNFILKHATSSKGIQALRLRSFFTSPLATTSYLLRRLFAELKEKRQ